MIKTENYCFDNSIINYIPENRIKKCPKYSELISSLQTIPCDQDEKQLELFKEKLTTIEVVNHRCYDLGQIELLKQLYALLQAGNEHDLNLLFSSYAKDKHKLLKKYIQTANWLDDTNFYKKNFIQTQLKLLNTQHENSKTKHLTQLIHATEKIYQTQHHSTTSHCDVYTTEVSVNNLQPIFEELNRWHTRLIELDKIARIRCAQIPETTKNNIDNAFTVLESIQSHIQDEQELLREEEENTFQTNFHIHIARQNQEACPLQAIGVSYINKKEKNCMLSLLLTHPDNLHLKQKKFRGAATAVLTHLCATAIKNQKKTITVMALPENVAFYYKLGFEQNTPENPLHLTLHEQGIQKLLNAQSEAHILLDIKPTTLL